MKLKMLLCVLSISIVACNSGSNSATTVDDNPLPPKIINNIPLEYQNLPVINGTQGSDAIKIAYSQNGLVGGVSDPNLKNKLQSMAVALSYGTKVESPSIAGLRYCTGTPIYKNGDLAFVLTAAHCVMGNPKNSNTTITSENIVTFSKDRGHINQVANALAGSNNTGDIKAVYVPQSYCTVPNFTFDEGNYFCGDLEQQNGDIALLKVQSSNLMINNQVHLASGDLSIIPGTLFLTLGYGLNNFSSNNTKLAYINYEYFGSNYYAGINSEKSILNGYNPVSPNIFYSIICGGDSGGGDFYWDGANWDLVGVHSFGSSECGAFSNLYNFALDVSGDVRPFVTQINNIIAGDTDINGCAKDVASSNGFICKSRP